MDKIGLIAWITFKDSVRNKVLHGIFSLAFLLFAANIIITGMFSWELGKVAVDVGLSAVSISGLMIIFFFSINMISNDLERKTIYVILAKPISKAQYILGKFVGMSLIVLLSSVILGICSAASVKLATMNVAAFIPAFFSWKTFFLGLCFLTLSLWLLMAIAFLSISFTTHSFTAVLISMLSYFIGQNIENVSNIITRGKIFSDNITLFKITKFVSWIFPNLAVFDLKTTAAYGLPVDPAYLSWVAVYGISYIGICLMFTILIFQRRELA